MKPRFWRRQRANEMEFIPLDIEEKRDIAAKDIAEKLNLNSGAEIHVCLADDMHPYNCDGMFGGRCIHCEGAESENHNPATCALCRWDEEEEPEPVDLRDELDRNYPRRIDPFMDEINRREDAKFWLIVLAVVLGLVAFLHFVVLPWVMQPIEKAEAPEFIDDAFICSHIHEYPFEQHEAITRYCIDLKKRGL